MKSIEARFDLETIFRTQYERIGRVIAKVVGDPARAEELAVEVFLKLWRNRQAQDGNTEAGCTGRPCEWVWMNSGGKHARLAMNACSDSSVACPRLRRSSPRPKSRRKLVWC